MTLITSDITNNSSTPATFQTSDAVYAHNFEGSGIYRWNQDEETSMGNTFEIVNNVTLPAASVKFETGTTATVANVNLWRYNPDDPAFNSVQAMEFIDEVDYAIQATDIASGSYTTIPFNTPIDLEAGWFYVLSVKKYEGTDRIFIGGSSEGDDDFSTVCYGPFGTGGAINFFIGFGFAPSVRMAFQDAPVVTSDDADNILCAGSSLILTSSAATGNQWQDNGVDIPGETNPTLTVNATGSYSCVAGGFSSLVTNVSISTTDNTTITSTDGTVLTANQGGATYQWINCTTTSPVAGATNQMFAPTENGDYQVQITFNGCPMVASACTAVLLPLEVTSSNNDTILCDGSTLTLTSSLADGNNIWSDGTSTIGTTDVITITDAGTYTVTNTSTSQTSEAITITVITIDNTVTGTTTLTAAQAGGATYQWMENCNIASTLVTGETTQAYTPLSDGDYSVEISLNGCSVTSTCTTVNLPLAINSVGNLTVCAGGTLELNSTKTLGNQWQKDGNEIVGATNQTFTATESGVYTCLNNSVVSNAITFTVAAPVNVAVTQSANTVDMSADQTSADYKWVNCAAPSVTLATTQAFSATVNGSYQVIVTVGACSDTSDCMAVQGVGITENAAFSSFSVYPNPAAENVAIDYALKNESKVNVAISDLSGKVVYTSNLGSKTACSHNLAVNTTSFANGIYVVNFATENGHVTEKLVIRK